MGLSFLVARDAAGLDVTVRWGDYTQSEIAGPDGKAVAVWQRIPREERVPVPVTEGAEPTVHDVPESRGLQVHVLAQPISASEGEAHILTGTRSVSVFLVNRR